MTIADGANVPAGIYNNAVDSQDLAKNPLQITYANGNTYIGACFLSGSMIRTTNGEVAVEDVHIGDEVIAFDWRNKTDIVRPVVWVGKAHVNVRHGLPDDEAGWPVRILKDAIDDGVPYKDMLITAEHCLFFKDRFVPARMLVNGVSIFYDKSITSYDYYHVETEQHSVITADGMLTESYLDTGNRSSFRQEGKVATLRGAVKSWEDDAGAPLGVERSFVEPLFRTLEWREDKVSAEQVHAAPELTSDPDLHLVTTTGATIRPMRQTAQHYSFMLPPDTKSVSIVSRASRPSDVIGPFVDDRRYMGVAVGEVRLFCAKQQFDITSHLTAEKPAGWHADMAWDGVAWTSGNAELPLGDHLTHGKMGILSMTVRAAGPYIVDNQKVTKTAKSA
ncbi:outer membrane protein [Acetobacter malorum]|uniref:Outer membrane protein n=1 Tax=Acetobacter malorum TaxID=178901 RepID=A0A177FU82_9PROT|nr:outer membrane protein [Acetobacter malorum]